MYNGILRILFSVIYIVKNQSPVPHLTTALSEPLHYVESLMIDNQTRIESWFRSQWRKTPAPFYASVDLRNSGYKIAPVDTNLFPAGFNNLNPAFEPLCIQAIQLAFDNMARNIDRILIIPENHTRNLYYLENVSLLQTIIEKAGFEVQVGSLLTDLKEAKIITLNNGTDISLCPVIRENDLIKTGEFLPDIVLLNNDLSGGLPDILKDLQQPVVPYPTLGWTTRLKSVHFGHYQEISTEFAKHIDIDPWLFEPMFRNCGEIDFMRHEGTFCMQNHVDTLLSSIRKKYEEYGVKDTPYVVVKADSGTYGMGIMTVQSSSEVLELNRKERIRMSTTKEGQKITSVIIQEGVYTNEKWGNDTAVAEPVVYMIDKNVVGGFYRVHAKKGVNENLNSPGMRFERLMFDDCCISPDKDKLPNAHRNRFYAYGVIARLANLAAARESIRL